MTNDIDKVGLLVVDDNRMLLCRKSRGTDLLILPGGKRDPGENDETCVRREIREELGSVGVDALRYIDTYRDRAAGQEERFVRIALYAGTLDGTPTAQAEIAELVWFGANDDRARLSAVLANHIVPDLIQRDILRW